MIEFKYRPDVDGLRAVAVILVLLFHGGFGFHGGFVGVDVFFVISGFLITGLLLKDQQSDDFQLAHFWVRRIRRILPAAMFVLLTTLIAGFFVLLPGDYQSLAESATAQQAMMSNVYFWRNTGYFAGDAELKPLLHTWSLSVEEQFYLFYPFLVVLLYRFARRFMPAAMIVLLLVSFGVSEWQCHANPSAAFYLLPMRAWELLLGGVLCFAPTLPRNAGWFANVLGVLGVAGILLAAWRFDATTTFPGVSALLPCVGTALVVYANAQGSTLVGRVLAAKPVVYVGLISYSLYLWHWPLLCFLRHLHCGAQPDRLSRVAALAASFVLAALSLRYLESPFRAKQVLAKTKHLLIATVSVIAVGLAFSLSIVALDGLPQRLDPRAVAYAAAQNSQPFRHEVSIEELRGSGPPKFGVPDGSFKLLVWGDSHAMALVAGIDAACEAHYVEGFQATHSNTPPLLDFIVQRRWAKNEKAPDFNRVAIDFAIKQKVNVVILAAFWSDYAHHEGFERSLVRTIEELDRAGIQVVIVKDVALHDGNVPLKLSMAIRMGQDVDKIGVPLDEHLRRNELCNEIFDRIKKSIPSLRILDPAPRFVDESGLWRAEYDGEAMCWDHTHLTAAGSLRLKPLFERLFDDLGMK
jgi:peptidoglycan/LPS O-acetylase OafA/YrhL